MLTTWVIIDTKEEELEAFKAKMQAEGRFTWESRYTKTPPPSHSIRSPTPNASSSWVGTPHTDCNPNYIEVHAGSLASADLLGRH
jgi:hypothetical protein